LTVFMTSYLVYTGYIFNRCSRQDPSILKPKADFDNYINIVLIFTLCIFRYSFIILSRFVLYLCPFDPVSLLNLAVPNELTLNAYIFTSQSITYLKKLFKKYKPDFCWSTIFCDSSASQHHRSQSETSARLEELSF
jgi:hypothetical protein